MPFFIRKRKQPEEDQAVDTAELLLYGHALPNGHLAIIADDNQAIIVLGDLLSNSDIPSVLVERNQNASFMALGHSLDHSELKAIESDCSHTQLRSLLKSIDNDPKKPLIVLGRKLGTLWPTSLNLIQRSHKHTRIIADVSLQTTLPLPLVFKHFLVEASMEKNFDTAVERWHRHEKVKPTYVKRWLGGGISLYSRQ